MNKFTNNQSSEETTAAYLYELEEAHRQEEQELTEIADAQWHAFQDDHDTDFYEWTDEAIAWEEGMRSDNLYDDDDPYDGEMWEDAYDDHPADMYEWDCDLHNEF